MSAWFPTLWACSGSCTAGQGLPTLCYTAQTGTALPHFSLHHRLHRPPPCCGRRLPAQLNAPSVWSPPGPGTTGQFHGLSRLGAPAGFLSLPPTQEQSGNLSGLVIISVPGVGSGVLLQTAHLPRPAKGSSPGSLKIQALALHLHQTRSIPSPSGGCITVPALPTVPACPSGSLHDWAEMQ